MKHTARYQMGVALCMVTTMLAGSCAFGAEAPPDITKTNTVDRPPNVLSVQPAQSATNLGTIMPLGDSITTGVTPGGYRDPLYALLSKAGYTFKYVGSCSNNPSEALAAAGQDHHEGHSNGGVGSGMVGVRWIEEHLGEILSNNPPDRILVTIGANDMRGSDSRVTIMRMNKLIDDIFTLRPAVKLYIASVPPQAPGPVVRVIDSFNKTVEEIVAGHRVKGRQVVFVSMSAINPLTDMSGYMDPGRRGCQKMAQAWYDALVAQ